MYLKSLTLKGFKSFADRTVMRFEPGVAAVVGPNGSGKSNISDAVLWVLGERNAKNLRGQSMEDVIFAGSSARKPVSVAEVELLLDNSDGVLPVDFSEVSIGRRMYRSGESEYLINGNVVRRMDVLDILHDSGLGTGTNSIISQGNLDRVLSSKPEDRRALIEEAAGILKHKERKAKSERKLAQMDNHLARVNDITAEVERQLKPLERKARKALQYQDLAAELSDLKLKLAVDDLRGLQKRWDETLETESTLEAKAAELRASTEAAEAALDELQQKLAQRGAEEGTLNARFRRAQASSDRLGSARMVVREKLTGYQAEMERLTRSVEEGHIRRRAAQAELEDLRVQESTAAKEHEAALATRDSLEAEYKAQQDQRNGLRREIDTLMSSQRALRHRQETIQATQAALRENLSEKRARAQVIEAHIADAQQRYDAARQQADAARTKADQAKAEFESIKQKEAQARSALSSLTVSRNDARQALDAARDAFTQATAERSALEELERASEAANPALSHVLDAHPHNEALPITHALSAPEHLDALVEALLGSDVHALLVGTEDTARTFLEDLLSASVSGDVALVAPGASTASATPVQGARHLVDVLKVKDAHRAQVEALLGDVYVVDTLEEALAQRSLHAGQPFRFATADGFIVWPNGKISLTRQSAADRENSALVRRRSLEAARAAEEAARSAYEEAQESDGKLEDSLRQAQSESLKCSELLAQATGRDASARDEHERAAEALTGLEAELERLKVEQREAQEFLDKSQPDSENLETELAQVTADLDMNKQKVAQLNATLNPLQKKLVEMSEQVSDARMQVARLSERHAYASRMVSTRQQEIASTEREDTRSNERMQVARVASQRAEEISAVLSRLLDAAGLAVARLETESQSEAQRSRGLHEQIASATHASREAHDAADAMSARLGDVRIEKGRLEVQVEGAIKVITEECETSLETALALDALEDRTQAAERAGSLERRIKNMGTINPDAAEEFAEVSERYRYLTAQLEDMRAARRALTRIVKVIDDRMRDDFVNTFNQVNDNFAQIFSTLFPGGQAHLSLVDPDDVEHTGVDVNAQPIGKRVKKMSLLSGGEKSMTAMALLFAVYRTRQTPFYILDEVEAALDDTNLRRLLAYLNGIRNDTQFIMITHQRRTMESADILYGVSMQADGVTKVLSQKLEGASRKGN